MPNNKLEEKILDYNPELRKESSIQAITTEKIIKGFFFLFVGHHLITIFLIFIFNTFATKDYNIKYYYTYCLCYTILSIYAAQVIYKIYRKLKLSSSLIFTLTLIIVGLIAPISITFLVELLILDDTNFDNFNNFYLIISILFITNIPLYYAGYSWANKKRLAFLFYILITWSLYVYIQISIFNT